jgi:putative Holliday junction resolvase|tara:strand:- start:1745 stop:2155 length:411 start_codon:yes stop_codon:yes gene_type:complete
MGKAIGIDYGTKRTGIAISDSLQIIASALITVKTSEIFTFLKNLVREEDIEVFIIGSPIGLDGRPTDSTELTDLFVKKLSKMFIKISVKRMDERFTSKIAKQTILASGIRKRKRRNKELVDKISAAIILQNYLDYS